MFIHHLGSVLTMLILTPRGAQFVGPKIKTFKDKHKAPAAAGEADLPHQLLPGVAPAAAAGAAAQRPAVPRATTQNHQPGAAVEAVMVPVGGAAEKQQAKTANTDDDALLG
jgi:hypothetical protein